MTQALTFELLRRRTVAIYERLFAEHEQVEHFAFERLVCDRCGLTLDLFADPFPIGWTTVGDAENGWADYCRSCSQ